MNWKRLPLVVWLLCAWLPFLSSSVGAQEPSDIILYNGKIVTVDDDSFTSNLGTIAQAIHIKDGTILHVGANAEIRAMAGPGTKVIDLKGRFVMPGIINTHDHPMDWDPLNPYIIRNVVTDDVHIERFLWDEPPDEKLLKFPAFWMKQSTPPNPASGFESVYFTAKSIVGGMRLPVSWAGRLPSSNWIWRRPITRCWCGPALWGRW